MQTRLIRSRTLAAGSLCALAIAAAASSRTAKAFNPQPDPPRIGMVGIAEGQTSRLNLVNVSAPDDVLIPPPCRAHLQLLDADGNVLAQRRVSVAAGHAAFVDFRPSFVPTNLGDVLGPPRAEIRAAVDFADGVYPPPCRASLEIFDNVTGRTQIALLPPPCRGAQCRVQP
jgi:hypothetical protein